MCVGSHGTVHVWDRGQLWSGLSPSSLTWPLGLSSGHQACAASAPPPSTFVSKAVTRTEAGTACYGGPRLDCEATATLAALLPAFEVGFLYVAQAGWS